MPDLDATTPIVAPFPPDRHWKVGALWNYWQGLSVALDRIPRRADIDPIEIPKLLPNVWIVDIEPRSRRFRYRIIGTAVTRARNSDMTGGLVESEVPDLASTELGIELDTVFRDCRPIWSKAPPPRRTVPEHDVVEIERLSLPLAGQQGDVEMALNLSVFRLRTGELL